MGAYKNGNLKILQLVSLQKLNKKEEKKKSWRKKFKSIVEKLKIN